MVFCFFFVISCLVILLLNSMLLENVIFFLLVDLVFLFFLVIILDLENVLDFCFFLSFVNWGILFRLFKFVIFFFGEFLFMIYGKVLLGGFCWDLLLMKVSFGLFLVMVLVCNFFCCVIVYVFGMSLFFIFLLIFLLDEGTVYVGLKVGCMEYSLFLFIVYKILLFV